MTAKQTDPTMHVLINLRLWRLAAGLEESKLAALAGIDEYELAALEAGEAAPALLAERLADTLGVELVELVDRNLAPRDAWIYPKRVRIEVRPGKTGQEVMLFWCDWLFLALRSPERSGGFTCEEIAERSGITCERVAEIAACTSAATHRELSLLARATGLSALQILTQD